MTLKQFIKANNLTFNEGERNTNVTILCGYALHMDKTVEDCKQAIPSKFVTGELNQEIERVYDYADCNDYGNYWTSDDAISRYKF